MKRRIAGLLNLRSGDLGRGFLLLCYYFVVIASFSMGQVARDSLFLGRFSAAQLPYADITTFAVVAVAASLYIRVARRMGLRNLLLGSLASFSTWWLISWWLILGHDGFWLYVGIYVGVGVFGVLAPAQVWTLTNYVLAPREAKRLFGLLFAGGGLGMMCGGYFATTAARLFGAESILASMAVLLLAAAALVALIWRRRPPHLACRNDGRRDGSENGPRSLGESLRHVLASPYLQAMAGLVLISSLVTAVAGWQFKAIVKATFIEKDALAVFMGTFTAVVGAGGLLAQLAFTSRVLARFTMGTVLFIFPVVLLMGSTGLLIAGSLWAVICLRGGDKILRYSIDRPAAELLYLPVPSRIKVQVKVLIDTVIWRLGDGLQGVTILVFATILHLSAVQVTWVNLVFLALWFLLAALARKRYVDALRDSIQQHRLDAEQTAVPLLDRSATELAVSRLDAVDPEEILSALSLLSLGGHPGAHPAMRGLLEHPSPKVRQKAISVLDNAGDASALDEVGRLLRDPDLQVRTEALLYVSHHSETDALACIEELGDFPDSSIRSAIVVFLARPGKAQNLTTAHLLLDLMLEEEGPERERIRVEAARLLRFLPSEFEDVVGQLIEAPEVEVAREAIGAAERLGLGRFAACLVSRLPEPELRDDASTALTSLGASVVGSLREALSDPEIPVAARREIPSVLVGIGSHAAAAALVDNVLEPDTALRYRIVTALNAFLRKEPELPIDRSLVETALAAEILGHYRSYQIAGTLGDGPGPDPVAGRALKEAMAQEVERIFGLMRLLFPRHDLESAHLGLQSTDPVVHDHALDFLENVLRPELRRLLVPLVDGDVSLDERVSLGNALVGAPVKDRGQAIAALAATGDPWLKSCAAYAIGALGLSGMERDLDAWLADPDPLVRETARQAKLTLRSGSEGES
jgi:AAA family ATP:ADP antiporter